MNRLQSELSHTLEQTPASLDQLSTLIEPQWVEQALAVTGKAAVRRRKLPAEHVVWLVIGLALFRNQPIWHVVRQLDLTLEGQPMVVPSATVQARQRLGEEPLQRLFGLLAQAWTSNAALNKHQRVLGLRALAVDGVVWSAVDTPHNRQSLGCSASQHGPGDQPQIRAVCLMDTHSHELLDARLGSMAQGELTLAAELGGCDQSLTVFDRAYFSAAFLLDWPARGKQRHWLMRAKDNLRFEVLSKHAPGDCTMAMPISPRARKLQPSLPSHWQARLIEVTLGGRKRRFITSLSDAKRYRAKPLAHLYIQRWEIELGFREIKQSLQMSSLLLRSKQPDLVRQELWGMLIAYTLMRRLMRQMAEQVNVQPVRMGFHASCMAIVALLRFAPLESAATLPKRLALLFEQAHLFVIPQRRPHRSYPRVVKRRPTKYPTKMPVSA
jgi:hypothetical protein